MSRHKAKDEGPHFVDIHVGHRLRQRRGELGISQSVLGDRLGITFQQVQKYERGANRISASMLYKAATALSVSIGYFFEDLPGKNDSGEPVRPSETSYLAASPNGHRLLHAILELPGPVRLKVSSLVSAIGARKDDDSDED